MRIKPAPLRLSILIGDCLFNLRSALDHLALALARTYTPGLTEKQTEDSQFPIFADPANYAEKRTKAIGCGPAAQDDIEKLQPYHTGNNPGCIRSWDIHNLNNIDKHRSLTVFAAMPIEAPSRGFQPRSGLTQFLAFSTSSGEINIDLSKTEIDAVYVRWAGVPNTLDGKMSMDPTAPTEVAFGEGPLAGDAVVPCLQSLNNFVGDSVIAPLSKYL